MPFLLMSTDVKIWLLCETEIKIKKEKYNVKMCFWLHKSNLTALPLQLNVHTQLLELPWIPVTSATQKCGECNLLYAMLKCAN